MATAAEIAALRVLIAEADDSNGYTNFILGQKIDAGTTAADIWQEKAASYAGLVDVTEGGSSRKLSQLASQALAMSKALAADASGGATAGFHSGTRAIERV